ncbi:MAG: hypothetical protein ACK5PQ_01585, partial [Alphaproteobacteria bacterium]
MSQEKIVPEIAHSQTKFSLRKRKNLETNSYSKLSSQKLQQLLERAHRVFSAAHPDTRIISPGEQVPSILGKESSFQEIQIFAKKSLKTAIKVENLSRIALNDIPLHRSALVTVTNLFTFRNVTRLFNGEFNGRFLKLPNIFTATNYDTSRFLFQKESIIDSNGVAASVDFLPFKLSEETVRHIWDLLSDLTISSRYIVAPKGVGKSYICYFVTCLMMGMHENYYRCITEEDLDNQNLWKTLDFHTLLGRIPIFNCNSPVKIHAFEEISIYCSNFYPQIAIELEEFQSVGEREFCIDVPQKEISKFLAFFRKNHTRFIFIVDQLNNMEETNGSSLTNQFISSFPSIFRGFISSSANIETFAESNEQILRLIRSQSPIFQFGEEDLFELLESVFQINLGKQIFDVGFEQDEIALIKEHLKEAVSGISSNIRLFYLEIKKCSLIFQQNPGLSPIQRTTILGQVISEFILSQKDQFEVEYKSFLKTI